MSSENLLKELCIDDVINQIKLGKFHYKIAMLVYFNIFQQNSQIALPGLILPSITNEFNLTKGQISLYGTFEYLGYFLSSLLIGKISDKLGRRNGILIFKAIWLALMLLSILSPNIYFFMVLRCLISISFVIVFLCSLSLVSEIWPQKTRGIAINLSFVFIALAHISTSGLGRFFIDDLKSANWRLIFIISSIILGFSLLLNYKYLEESPRYDLFLGKKERAFSTIEKMAFENMNDNNFLKEGKKEQIEIWVDSFKLQMNKVLENKKEDKQNQFISEYKKLFKGNYKKITLTMFATWIVVSSNFFGLEFILPSVLLKLSANSDQNPLTLLLTFNLLVLPCLIPTIAIVENKTFGRRKTLLIIFFVMGVGGLGTFFDIFPGNIFWLFFFKLSNHCSFMLIYLFTTELYPTSLRMNAIGQSSAISRLGVILIVWVSVYLMDIGAFVPFVVFGSLGFFAFYILSLLNYETYNENIDRIIE